MKRPFHGSVSYHVVSKQCIYIEKDVVRTDRFLFHPNDDDNKLVDQPCLHLMKRVLTAYVTKDAELDYVQGMNDYLSPIVYVFTKDEVIESAEYLVFWVFNEFMSIIVSLTCHSQTFILIVERKL